MKTLDLLRQQEGFSLVEILEALGRQGLDKRLIVLLMVGLLAACGGEEKKDKKNEGETTGQTTQQVKKEKQKKEMADNYEICQSLKDKLKDQSINREFIGPDTYSTEVLGRAEEMKHMCNFIINGKKNEALLYLAKAANEEECYGQGNSCDLTKAVARKFRVSNENGTVKYCENVFESIPFSNNFENKEKQLFKKAGKETCTDIYKQAEKYSWSDWPFFYESLVK